MRVTFVFAGQPRVPIGGFAVAYEYANQLSRRGHEVTLVHRRAWDTGLGPVAQFRSEIRGFARRFVAPIPQGGRPSWFVLDDAVASTLVPSLKAGHIPDSDAVISTSWETTGHVHSYPARKGTKFNLIQHYETWAGPPDLVDATWRLPMRKIVIARWLADMAIRLGDSKGVSYIPNGIDLERFRIRIPIEVRDPHRVGMLHHRAAWKGTADGLAALSAVRSRIGELDAVLFGTDPRPELPAWVTYVHHPIGDELAALYNSFAIFLHPSWTEGWPLPPAEAMASGCALVAAANHGVSDYAEDGSTALMTPIKDPDALTSAVLRVINDDTLRVNLARAGHARIQEFTWDRAANAFEAVLRDHAPGG